MHTFELFINNINFPINWDLIKLSYVLILVAKLPPQKLRLILTVH